jgi:transposase-like protein
MRGMLAFRERYGSEAGCIEALARLRWPQGYVCARCGERRSSQLKTRPRTFECARCGHQESVTAGTIFHRTRTPLRKWFLAAWWMARDKRGVSALLLSRELGLRYETAWLMAHKLRHALTERPEFSLEGLVEVDESYYGGRGKPESRGRSLADPNKSLLVVAVEKVRATQRQGRGIKESGFVAGSARLAILPAATGDELGAFVGAAVKAGARVITDGYKGYNDLAEDFRHYALVQKTPKNAETILPVIHVLFSNIKAWLNGTFHGVSAKHLPRYATEWTYRFNRRGRIAALDDFVLRRAVQCKTITYRQLIDGFQPKGVSPVASG